MATTIKTHKTATNFKFVQVSGEDKVCVIQYDAQENRIAVSTPVVRAKVCPERGPVVQTESGQIYRVPFENQHASMWRAGLQIKRPEVYQKLVDNGVL